jgi:O-antigen/teichoic acid export membrane protein
MWFGLAGATGKVLALLTVPFLSRALTPAGYGLADLATALAALLTITVMFAGDLSTAKLCAKADSQSRRQQILGMYLVATTLVSIGVSLVLIPLSGTIAATLWSAPEADHLALLALLLVPVSAIQAALANVQRLESRAPTFAVLAIIDLLAQLGLAVLFVAAGLGPAGVILGFLAGSTIGLAVAAMAARPYVRFAADAGLIGRIIGGGLPLLPPAVLFLLADYVARWLIIGVAGEAGVGYFGVAIRLSSVMVLVTYAFSQAWGPLGLGMEPGERSAALFGRVMNWYVTIAGLASIAIATISVELVSLVSGEAFGVAAVMMPGLLAAAVLAGAYFVTMIGAGLVDRERAVALSSLAGATLQVVILALLLPVAGLLAVSVAAPLGQLAAFTALRGMAATGTRVSFGSIAGLMLLTAVAPVLAVINGEGSETVALRLTILLAVLLVSVAIGIRAARSTREPAAS